MLATSRQLQRAAPSLAVVRRALPATLVPAARRGYATPAGPPPRGFRLTKHQTWETEKESTMDRAGSYFLMTEMMRGMYLLMEQFFRPPYVSPPPALDAFMGMVFLTCLC